MNVSVSACVYQPNLWCHFITNCQLLSHEEFRRYWSQHYGMHLTLLVDLWFCIRATVTSCLITLMHCYDNCQGTLHISWSHHADNVWWESEESIEKPQLCNESWSVKIRELLWNICPIPAFIELLVKLSNILKQLHRCVLSPLFISSVLTVGMSGVLNAEHEQILIQHAFVFWTWLC